MADDKKSSKRNWKKKNVMMGGSPAVSIYGLGFIGAAIYYVQLAEGFGEILVALLKAIVWPAYLVYELLKSTAA